MRPLKVANIVMLVTSLFCVLFYSTKNHVRAAEIGDIKQEVDTINKAVQDKRNKVKDLDKTIDGYRKRITDQEKKQISLENEIGLLGNRIVKKQLDIERAKIELEAVQLELQDLDASIKARSTRLEVQKSYAKEIVLRMRDTDGVLPLEVLLTKRSLSAFFDRVEEIKRLERRLSDVIAQVSAQKLALEQKKQEREGKHVEIEKQQKVLDSERLALEAEQNLKTSLATETKLKQSEFERVLYELKGEQQSASDDIVRLENKLKDKIDRVDAALARGDILLNWPVDPSRGITATFHDPTYPFKNLFQHPGVDVRVSVGSPVRSAAGGYVAWNKKGRMYGNYTMVIHPGNIATVYAHLSKFIAQPDTYIDRGGTIGQSGGRPGDPGAGLSTGPHLHFEVRQNGIPVDPENFLPNAPHDN